MPLSPPVLVVSNDHSFKHLFRRSRSPVVERPQRIRFVNLGCAAALAWDALRRPATPTPVLLLPSDALSSSASPLSFLLSCPRAVYARSARLASLHHPAISAVHDELIQPPSESPSPIDPPSSVSAPLPAPAPSSYLDQLLALCRGSAQLHQLGHSEVPSHLPQADLYLSSGSESAILGALGACFDALDSVLRPPGCCSQTSPTNNFLPEGLSPNKAFVNVRPPGHHCTNSEPMGFCWVNNVLVSCLYSHLVYGIDRICVVDIDLHHGNGSQEIVWQINQRSSPHDANPVNGKGPSGEGGLDKRALKVSYSSLHDINSYPCEGGDPVRIKDASLNICAGNPINQFIQNLHIENWVDESDFYESLYPRTWSEFEKHMLRFLEITCARPEQTLIFVSAGFDACEYEDESMSRYSKKLPASFYHRFATDISRFAESHCKGRLISVLEGGYSEKTLVGSSLSYLLGLMQCTHYDPSTPCDFPWSENRVEQLLGLCRKGLPARPTRPACSEDPDGTLGCNDAVPEADWVSETKRIFDHIDAYDQVKSAWSRQIRSEDKLIKTQLMLKQCSLMSTTQASSEGMLRRSQRKVSHTGPVASLDISDRSPPCQPTGDMPDGLDQKKASTTAPTVVIAPSSHSSHNHPTPLPSVVQAHDHQSIDALFTKLHLGTPLLSDTPHSPPLQHQPEEGKDQGKGCSVDRQGEGSRGDLSSNLSSNASIGCQGSLESTGSGAVRDEKHAGKQVPQALPKVKLVWKAGGIMGSASQAAVGETGSSEDQAGKEEQR